MIDDITLYLKASCLASMKKQKYTVYVCLTLNENGPCTIDFAYCQCLIGLAQSCSHIGGLLFTISNRQNSKDDMKESCTSKLCTCKVPRNANQCAQPLRKINICKPKLDRQGETVTKLEPPETSSQTEFDPRHIEDRLHDASWTVSQLMELKRIFPRTDPPPVIDDELVTYIEEHTRDQRLCPLWRELHKCRLTSSLFGSVLTSGSNLSSLIKQIVEGSSLDRYAKLPEAVQWGVEKEPIVKEEYIRRKNLIAKCEVLPTGLTLYGTHSFLWASTDGLVKEEGDTGIIEIKCPFSRGGEAIHLLEIDDILSKNDSRFCMINTSEGSKLKKKS